MSDQIGGLTQELAFPINEYEDRCRRLREVMREPGLDVMLVHQPPSVFYFLGNENLHVYDNECVIVPRDGEVSLLVPQADLSRARLTSWVRRIENFPPGGEAGKVLARMLADQGLQRARVGIEKRVARASCLSVHAYETLRSALPEADSSTRRAFPSVSSSSSRRGRSPTSGRPPPSRTPGSAPPSGPPPKAGRTTTSQLQLTMP
jgi:Xaa-Pro aminopeptidase